MPDVFELVTVPSARRSLKKLPLPVRKHLLKATRILSSNPRHGEQLKDQWKYLRSFHTFFRRTHYRVVYEVNEKTKEVIIRYVATRENFYRSLRKLGLKPLD